MMTANENRPHMVEAASEKRLATQDQDTGAPPAPHLSAAEIAESRPLYLVVVKTQTDRRLRRVYLSLASAEKAVHRARERGSAATLELHRLVPYTVGAELHELGGEPR